MKLLPILIGIFWCTIGQAQEGWKEFKSFEGQFRILIPGVISESVDSIDTDVGRLAYHSFVYQPDSVETAENLIYLVNYVDYPANSVHSDSTEILPDFFKETIAAATEAVSGNLIYSSKDDYRDFPGMVWRIEYLEDRAVIRTKAYLVKNRYYSISTIALKERALNNSSEEFFESFRIF